MSTSEMLSDMSRRDRPHLDAGTVFADGGAVLVVVSLFLPWFASPALQCVTTPCPSGRLISAWSAFRFADVLLVVMAVTVVLGVRMAGIVERRLLGALVAFAGWCGAAGSIYAIGHPDLGVQPLIARASGPIPAAAVTSIGYFACLVGCGAIVIGGLITALAGRSSARKDLL